MTTPAVRPVTADDLDALRVLVLEATRELRAQRGGSFLVDAIDRPTRDEAAMLAHVHDADRAAWVATIDDVAVGYAYASLRATTTTRIVMIDELFTTPEARAIGVGERLVDEVSAWAIVNEASGVSAVALPGARETKNFFEGMGMKARSIVVHRDL